MRRTLLLTAVAFLLVGLDPGASEARKRKKKPAPAGEVQKKEEDKSPPPGYKGTNEGASGRRNATEDASKSVESPTYERRP